MKLLFAFAIIAIALSVVYGAPDTWNEYKTKHGKKYDASEDGHRKKLFLAKDATIKKHNSQTKATYQLGHNDFSDMTATEMGKFIGAVKPANKSRSLESLLAVDMEDRALPTSLDYRGHACLPRVRNQKQCGSCWAFAAITPLEFARCMKHGVLRALSEQHLVDCEPYDSGCGGGWYTNAWYYLQNVAGGAAKRSLYPYTATDNTCAFTSSMIGVKISSYTDLATLNAANMQLAVQTYGPISVAIAVVNSFFSYASGVYTDVECDDPTGYVNHAVVVVGWGTDNGIDYWIVRNSWGIGWGQEGYLLMERGVNKCQIEQYPATILSVV